MARIYLSATYTDLKAHRDAVYRILRMLRHDVISMEDYVATDTYPLHKCLDDVAASDVYVGLVGWRYGYIPERDNPERKSITELEYRQVGKSGLPRLMFLVDKEAPWADEFRDSKTGEGDGGQRIAAFRAELEQAMLVRRCCRRLPFGVSRRLASRHPPQRPGFSPCEACIAWPCYAFTLGRAQRGPRFFENRLGDYTNPIFSW